MKTLKLRVCYLGLALTSILLAPGAEDITKPETEGDVPDPVAEVLPPLLLTDVDADPAADIPAPPAPLADPAEAGTNASAKPPVKIAAPTPPSNLKLSPGLFEVIKLIQAGVGEEVLMAYITNSTDVFAIDSDTIVYLNDLGVANNVITALIQHDSSPASVARRASANAVQPLPAGVATTNPVQNVYPPAVTRTYPVAGQTTYPGDFSTVIDTNPPAATTELTQAAPTTEAPAQNVTVNHFYSSLAPYGTWMDIDGYGLCWQPTVAVADPYWRPYSHRGRWLWSDYGWYWYSDYSWGWAPFHYGRWCSYPRVGWVWVPGSTWAPAWVTWRYSGSYCGWAPLPPGCGYRSGIGLTWYGRGVGIGFDFGLGSHCYTYVPVNRFCDWNVWRHCLPDNRLHVVHRSAVQVNKLSATRGGAIENRGIEVNTIARASRTKIPTMRVKDGGPMPVNQVAGKPERLEQRGKEMAVVRPQLPKPGTSVASAPPPLRGNATRGQAINLAGRSQPQPAANAQPVSPLAGGQTPRVNANRPAPSPLHPPQRQTEPPRQGNATRHSPLALAPTPTPNRPAAPQPNRTEPQRQTAPNNAPRSATPQPRNISPAPSRSTPPPAQATPPARNLAPPPVRSQPAARPNHAPQAVPRSTPAPAQGNSIRSYAEPARSVPQSRASFSPLHPPQHHAAPRAVPSAPQPAPRAQLAPPPSRPSAPAARSAPSNGGGNRSGGGKSRD